MCRSVGLVLLYCMLLFSCEGRQSKKVSTEKLHELRASKNVSNLGLIDSTISYVENFEIGGDSFRVIQYSNDLNVSVKNRIDTFRILTEYISRVEIVDFNLDGYDDILYDYNYSGIKELSIYDSETKSFKEVKGINRYYNPMYLTNDYMYSYRKNGCADYNWLSRLFYMKERVTSEPVKTILGRGCRSRNNNTGIFVYDDTRQETVLIDSLLIAPSYHKFKFEFIKDYWGQATDVIINQKDAEILICEDQKKIVENKLDHAELYSIDGQCKLEVNLDSDEFVESIIFVKKGESVGVLILEDNNIHYEYGINNLIEDSLTLNWVETVKVEKGGDTIFITDIDTISGDIIGSNFNKYIVPQFDYIQLGVEESSGSYILYKKQQAYTWFQVE